MPTKGSIESALLKSTQVAKARLHWHALSVATEQPLWLQLVLRFERAIGVPVESAVRSDAYFDLLTHANRTRARLIEVAEGLTQDWLHLLNLPASSDVKRLREQLARVERQLGRLAKEIEERDGRLEDTPRIEDG